jgi:hypothetical protein
MTSKRMKMVVEDMFQQHHQSNSNGNVKLKNQNKSIQQTKQKLAEIKKKKYRNKTQTNIKKLTTSTNSHETLLERMKAVLKS